VHPYSDRKNISSEEIQTLPYGSFKGHVQLIETPAAAERIAHQLSKEKILGFDTETRPAFKSGVVHRVALLQLSTNTHAWLFRLHHTGLPENIIEILSAPEIIKCGVAIRDDLKALQRLKSFLPDGFIELAKLAKENGLEVEGLRKLSAILLGLRISKSAQTTNWEARALTEKQINYAATDSWVCHQIYHQLLKKAGRS
jgi:ribonuclease D